MSGGVNVYLYGCVSLLAPECAVFLCVYASVFVCACVCLCWRISLQAKNHVSDLSKPDTLLHKMHSKVLLVVRFQDHSAKETRHQK